MIEASLAEPQQPSPIPNNSNAVLLSVIITSYTTKRMQDIFEVLVSMKEQSYSNIEIVFVAECSRELYDKVKSYAVEKDIHNLKLVFKDTATGICAARNLGVKEATGGIVAFTDDDAIVFPDWAEEIVGTFARYASIIGITGPALPRWEDGPNDWFPEELNWIIGGTSWGDWTEMAEVRNAWGVNMAFRKEAFTACHFAEDLGISEGAHDRGKVGLVGDDTEFSLNLRMKTGRPIIYNPRVRVWHRVYQHKLTPHYIRRQAYWQGYTKAILKRLYGKRDRSSNMLETEFRLLRRMLLRLAPGIAKDILIHPTRARKRCVLTNRTLFHLTVGYFSAVFPRVGELTTKAYR